MKLTRSRLTRRTWLTLGVLSLAGTYACADRVAAPPRSTPELDLEASGVFVSTLWRPTDTGAVYLGGIIGRAAILETAAGPRVTTEAVRPLGAPPPRATTLADPTLPARRALTAVARTLELKTKEGRPVRLQLVDDPRRDGRPPMAVVIREKDRPLGVVEYSYAREGKGWRVARSRTTLLDAAGKAVLVSETDAERARRLAPADALAPASPVTHDSRDEEYTDEAEAGVKCAAEKLAVAEKSALWAAAAAAVIAASSSCTLAPPACVVALLAAEAALAAADIALGTAIGNLYNCLNPPPPPPPPPPAPTSGGEDPGDGYEQWCEFEKTYVDGVLVELSVERCWWVKQ